MKTTITPYQIDRLIEALDAQAQACQATAQAMKMSARSAQIDGSSIHVKTHTASASSMEKFALTWAHNAMSARTDPAKAVSLLQKYPPSNMEQRARKEHQAAHKVEDRLERKIARLYKRGRKLTYIMALEKESSARFSTTCAWGNAVQKWERLRHLL